jgi:hypothetical protein
MIPSLSGEETRQTPFTKTQYKTPNGSDNERSTQANPFIVQVQHNQEAVQPARSQDKGDDRPKGWHKFVTWPEGWTTWAVIFTLGAICYQSHWTRKAVDAAFESANGIAKIERPWVLIEKIRFTKPGTVPFFLGNVEPERFHFTLKNYGRTPARITALHSRVDLGDSPNDPPHPEMFDLEEAALNPHIIPQGDYRDESAPLEKPMLAKEHLEILSDALFLWAYAVVRYEDVHGNKYQTRVCYRNDPDANKVSALRLDGPPEYNNAT